jgi:hypothetical protein
VPVLACRSVPQIQTCDTGSAPDPASPARAQARFTRSSRLLAYSATSICGPRLVVGFAPSDTPEQHSQQRLQHARQQ